MGFFNISQVRLNALSSVVRLETQGCNYWVTLYRLAYSDNCVTFQSLLDADGNELVINFVF